MDVGYVAVHTAEPLYVLAKVLSISLGDHLQIAGLTRELVATLVSANKMMAQIRPRRDGALRQVHQPRLEVGPKRQREVVGEHFLIPSPGSLHRDGVDAKELGWVECAVVLVGQLWLEGSGGQLANLPQLTSKRWAPHIVGQVPSDYRGEHVHRRPGTVIRLTTCFPASLDLCAGIFVALLAEHLPVILAALRI
jgi:hypothetical protein